MSQLAGSTNAVIVVQEVRLNASEVRQRSVVLRQAKLSLKIGS